MTEQRIITADDIYLFCEATGDSNKAHQGENPVVPGFMIDFLAKNHCDTLTKDQELQFSGLEMKFRDKLHQGRPFTITHRTEEVTGLLEYQMAVEAEDDLIADGFIFYRHILPEPRIPEKTKQNQKTGVVYLLKQPYYECVRKALSIEHEDRIAAAVSKAAHALQNDEESKGIILQETQDNRHPYFAKHSLTVYKNTPKMLSTVPASILIRTVKGDCTHGTHRVSVYGEADEGLIFDLTALIRFQ